MLRTAAQSLRLATAADLADPVGSSYVATVPGYVSQPGGPATVVYQPADHSGSGSSSVAITLYVQPAGDPPVCFGATECTPEGDLTYVRRPDTHGTWPGTARRMHRWTYWWRAGCGPTGRC